MGLNPEKWFKIFKDEYRRIVRERYLDKRDWFPHYRPTQFNVYLIEDPKKIFSEVEVFFQVIDEEEGYLADDVFVDTKKVEWPENFDSLGEYEKRMMIDTNWDELFHREMDLPSFTFSKSYNKDIFEKDSKEQAQIAVQEDLIEELPKKLLDRHLNTIELRRKCLGEAKIGEFLGDLKKLKSLGEDEKSNLISEAFWLLGFEVFNLEELKHLEDYKGLNQMPHVDVLAFFFPGKVLIAVEEGKINKGRWFKKDTLDSTLKLFGLKASDWSNYILMIGETSSSVHFLKDAPRRITYEQFFNAVNNAIKKTRWAPHLDAFKSILGESYKNIRKNFYLL